MMDDNAMTDENTSSLSLRDGSDAPLLMDGSTGRPRPQTFTFFDFMAIPPGPNTVPMTARSVAGVMLIVSAFATLPGILGLLTPVVSIPIILVLIVSIPFNYWRNFRLHGPIQTLQTQIRQSTLLFGEHSRQVAAQWFRMGMYYESQNNPTRALACYQKIVAFPVLRGHPGAAPYHTKIGKLLYALGRYEEALEAFETALTLRQQLEKAMFVLRYQEALHCIGQTHERLGHLDQALKVFSEAHSAIVQRGLNQSIARAKSLTLMARVLASMDRVEEALEKYQEALDIYHLNVGEFPRRTSIAELYTSMGDLQARQGQETTAAESYESAVEIFRRGGKSDQDRDMQSIRQKIADLKAENSV